MVLSSVVKYKSQKGAVLLLFMLILISALSYTLISKLNSATKIHTIEQVTSRALAEAKQALIAYAIAYPESHSGFGPGYLPCPDINNNGRAGSSCSYDGTNTTIGRFPWITLKMNDLRDSSGQRLWYVVSDNYKSNPKLEPLNSETPSQLNIDMDADGDIDGNDIDDIVAVIIAPGVPINNQNRDPTEEVIADEITHYLEAANADLDTDFVISNTDNINDQLVFITREELMEQVEKRVLGEVNKSLSNYKAARISDGQGAYPWLAPFADPKTSVKRLVGEHSGADDQANLTDSTADFTQWGVVAGDVIWNITDGSYGIVSVTPTAGTSTTLTIGAGLSLGSENDFDSDDEYYVDIAVPVFATPFIGRTTDTGGATAGSGLSLTDTNQDFLKLGVQLGDILELADGSSGVIEKVTTTELTVSSLTGATNSFSASDDYRIRTSIGKATVDSDADGLTLDDTDVDFTVMGIQVGDLVHNVTDGSFGKVSAAPTPNRLTVSELNLGSSNTFSINDYYVLPRYNSATNTREGLLPLHEPGEVFHTSFSIDWGALAADGSVVTSTPVTDAKLKTLASDDFTYADTSYGIKEWVERSSDNNSGTITVSESESLCTWINSTVAECTGTYTDDEFLKGTVTSVSGEYFYDTSQDFDDAGVYEGDKVENLDNDTKGLVDSATSTRIHFASITGETAFSIATGHEYRISIATKRIDLIAGTDTDKSIFRVYTSLSDGLIDTSWTNAGPTTTDTTGLTLVDSTATFTQFMEPGKRVSNATVGGNFVVSSVVSDTELTLTWVSGGSGVFTVGDGYRFIDTTSSKIIANDSVVEVNDPGAGHDDGLGLITGFGYNDSNGGRWFEYTELEGGHHDIHDGDNYRILYDFVDRREYEFNVRINSSSPASSSGFDEITTSGVRQRNVCLGYDADCTGSGTNTTIPGDGATAMVTIRDYNSSGGLVGDATTTVPSAGAQGRVKVSGINFFLAEDYGDIPSWFVNNDWHKLTYIAYSSGYAPGAAGVCTDGGTCLDINDVSPATPANAETTMLNEDIGALAIAAGMETNKTLDSDCVTPIVAMQDRASGTINEYFESDNCVQDDLFRDQRKATNFNDQLIVIESL